MRNIFLYKQVFKEINQSHWTIFSFCSLSWYFSHSILSLFLWVGEYITPSCQRALIIKSFVIQEEILLSSLHKTFALICKKVCPEEQQSCHRLIVPIYSARRIQFQRLKCHQNKRDWTWIIPQLVYLNFLLLFFVQLLYNHIKRDILITLRLIRWKQAADVSCLRLLKAAWICMETSLALLLIRKSGINWSGCMFASNNIRFTTFLHMQTFTHLIQIRDFKEHISTPVKQHKDEWKIIVWLSMILRLWMHKNMYFSNELLKKTKLTRIKVWKVVYSHKARIRIANYSNMHVFWV